MMLVWPLSTIETHFGSVLAVDFACFQVLIDSGTKASLRQIQLLLLKTAWRKSFCTNNLSWISWSTAQIISGSLRRMPVFSWCRQTVRKPFTDLRLKIRLCQVTT